MKKTIMIAAVLLTSALAQAEYVNGYTKSNGTYVQGYHRTSSDSSTFNNYSTQGNTNPYTGKSGTVNPYKNYYGN